MLQFLNMTEQKVFYTRQDYLRLEKRYSDIILLLIAQLEQDTVDLNKRADVISKAKQELKKTWQNLSSY